MLDPDEPVYAETVREMIANNDFVSPRIYGQYWYDKPPLYYWLVAGAFSLFGVSEFAARLPSALLALGGVLAVYRSATKLFGQHAGMISALVLTTSIEYFYLAKAAVTDITLTLFLTAAMLAFLEQRYYSMYFRFTTPEHTQTAMWYFFIPVLLVGFFPWTAVLIQAVRASLREWRNQPVLLFLVIWSSFIFFFFTLSSTKLVSYILPMSPPLAMIVG